MKLKNLIFIVAGILIISWGIVSPFIIIELDLDNANFKIFLFIGNILTNATIMGVYAKHLESYIERSK